MTVRDTPQAGRPSSQELADRVRESLVNTARWTSQEDYRYDERDSGLAALDVLAARLQATEQALREIERMGDYVYKPHEFAAVARRALEGDAE